MILLILFSTCNVLVMSRDIFVTNSHKLAYFVKNYCKNVVKCHENVVRHHSKTRRNFFFVFFLYSNFFLFKNIKKILTNTNDFSSNYQIIFFKISKKSYVENILRKKNKKPKK